MLLILILGAIVGAVMGLTGSGGGILAVPVLVLGLDWTIQQAMPVALVAVVFSASVGALDGFRQKLTRYRAAFVMALVGIPFSSVGLQLGQGMPVRVLMLVFAALMLLIAARDFRALHRGQRLGDTPPGSTACCIDPHTGQLRWSLRTFLIIGGIGAMTGLATGLLGVGGAFIMVPLLRRWTDISAQGIVATVLMVMALVASGGVAMAAWHGLDIPMAVTVPFAVSTVVGMVAGRLWVRRVDAYRLRLIYALLVLLVGVAMGIKGLW